MVQFKKIFLQVSVKIPKNSNHYRVKVSIQLKGKFHLHFDNRILPTGPGYGSDKIMCNGKRYYNEKVDTKY